MGRRKLEPDIRTAATLKNLGEWGATYDECAAWLGVSKPTFWKFITDFPDMGEAYETGKNTGKSTLRRWQWQAAKKGNVTMLIWLGKQMLKQRDDAGLAENSTKESIDALRSEIERKLARAIEPQPEGDLAKQPDSE